jgi:hypothetical protein
MTPYSFTRVLHESVEGDLDFKYQLSDSKLYYDPNNKVLYNKNEAGNYAWAYYLTLHGYSDLQGILTQGGSIIMQGRLDEPWDYRARWAGVEAAFERMGELWAYYVIYELFGQPQF